MFSVGSTARSARDTPTARESVVFVTRRGRAEVLVVRRCQALGGYWHAIAGAVEVGESFEQAALRELLEETGLVVGGGIGEIGRLPFIDSEYDLSPPCDGSGSPAGTSVRVRCFLLEVGDEFEPNMNWEHDAYRWCNPPEALGLLCWRNIRNSLAQLLGGRSRFVEKTWSSISAVESLSQSDAPRSSP
jgi:8-oxo-dGTP pyrophosphatase MutT (NUDIX family)